MSLAGTQRWFQAVITEPTPLHVRLEEVVASTPALLAHARLAIYARAYRARLLDCTRAMFPALCHALGDDLFTAFALDYFHQRPPRSPSLDRLADELPRHLDATRRRAAEQWPHFVVDLAALELLCAQVFDGPGLEGAPDAAPGDILRIPDAELLAAVPVAAPCMRTFASQYPVHLYMLAVRRGERPALPAAAPTFVAVTRRNYRVQLFAMSRDEHRALSRIDGERTTLAAADEASASVIRSWLLEWTSRGFIRW